jgi:hypothetical protein
MANERIARRKRFCGFSRRENAHRAFPRIGKGADHEELTRGEELAPQRAMLGRVKRSLGEHVVGRFVKQDVLHRRAPSSAIGAASNDVESTTSVTMWTVAGSRWLSTCSRCATSLTTACAMNENSPVTR